MRKMAFSLLLLFLTSPVFAKPTHELLETFHNELSSSKWNYMYRGMHYISSDNTGYLTVYVNDNWNTTPNDIKFAFIKECLSVYEAMHKSRKIDPDLDNLKLWVKHQDTDITIATWDSHLGPNIAGD
ncbi:MAG TPA: hypothetical protein VLB01_07770 [Thermodesulfobacteriota bacterium]|nr:hypothetical protein [Thermodesulfobacteriota bacterium]